MENIKDEISKLENNIVSYISNELHKISNKLHLSYIYTI